MKNLHLNLSIIVLIFCCISCNNDEIANVTESSHIELDQVIHDNIPSNLQTNTRLIYKSTLGEEWTLTIGNNTDVKMLSLPEGTTYTHEQITINAVDLTNNNLIYTIIGRGQFDQNQNITNNITSLLRYDPSLLATVGLDIDIDGTVKADFTSQFCDATDLNDDRYKTAYKIRDVFNSEIDKQIYYSPEFGVIAFTGPNDKIWILDRVEE